MPRQQPWPDHCSLCEGAAAFGVDLPEPNTLQDGSIGIRTHGVCAACCRQKDWLKRLQEGDKGLHVDVTISRRAR